MGNIALSCCSTADLSAEHFSKRDIHYVCFHFTIDGVTYFDDLGQSVPFDEFYRRMDDGAMTSTSQVNVDEYLNHFRPLLEAGNDILHVCLSSGLSGTYNSAKIARDMLQESYPARKIYIVDSLGASSGYGLLMNTLADLRDGGMDIDRLYAYAVEHRLNVHHWFFSTDLKFYVRGGRISRAAGMVGSIIGICPLLNMDADGHLVPRAKIRSKKRVINEVVERMAQHADGGEAYSGKCYISQSACYEDARKVADLIEQRFPQLNGRVEINNIGTTIGSHTGPGTVAVFFWGDRRGQPFDEMRILPPTSARS